MKIDPRGEVVPIDSVHPDPANSRLHPDRNLTALKGSLARFSQQKPIVVDGSGVIRAGNGTWRAAKELGWTEIWVTRSENLKGSEATAFSIADNRTSDLSAFDPDVLRASLSGILEDGWKAEDLASIGMSDLDLNEISPSFAGGLAGSTPIEEVEDESDEDEDALDLIMKAPFPWFGGKARVARKVWQRFGDVKCYVEPFFGSGAVMLNRPLPFDGIETVNDYDGLVSNLWRAIQKDPDQVAQFADWPILEPDLHARHAWLLGQKDSLQAKLEGDPEYFDAKVAGWYCWGLSCWIGSGFCAGDGPWQVVEAEDGSRQLVHLSGEKGVNRQRVHLSGEQGVNRQRVHLGGEQGVNRKRVHLGGEQGVNRKRVHLRGERGVKRQLVHLGSEQGAEDAGRAGCGEQGLLAWMRALSERLRRVRVCCGDWTRICGGESGDALSHFFHAGEPCGVFLDPPYSDLATRDPSCYRVDSLDVAHKVREWAIAHGEDPRLRIAYCSYGEKPVGRGWLRVNWKAQGGMGNLSVSGQGSINRFRETVDFSPHCAVPTKASEAESPEIDSAETAE